MFSKTVMVAGLVATTSAAATKTGLLAYGLNASYKSNDVACWECLTGNVLNQWAYKDSGKSTWYFTGVAVMTTKVKPTALAPAQGFCCRGKTTTEKASSTDLCGAAYSSGTTIQTGWSAFKAPTADKFNLLGAISECPQYMDVCGAPVKLAGAPVIGSGNRTATLKAKADSVTLPMTVLENNGEAKNWLKESCSYVVKSECGAPVITINAATDALLRHYELLVAEYTELGLGAVNDVGLIGGTDKWFLPAQVRIEIAVTNTNTAALKIGAAEPGNVLFKTGAGTYMRSVPGATLVDWMASITKLYTNHAATIGLFDKAVKDWNSGKRGAKPYVPAQPPAAATILDQLKFSVSTQTVKATIADRGYGNIVEYGISWMTVNKNAGAYFGVMQGINVLQAAAAKSIDPTAAKSMHWKSNTGKTAAGANALKCDPAYVMVTGIFGQEQVPSSGSPAKKFWVDVTEAAWAPTLEESVPAQPAAATAPSATGAGHLTVGAAAAALAALALF